MMISRQRMADDFFPLVSTANWGGRGTRAEVNLDAIAANVRNLRSWARSKLLLAIVKADAYGHGAVMTGRTALANGADRLAVYTVDEAMALRHGGIKAPIMVLGPFEPAQAAAVWDAELIPTVHTIEAATALQNAAEGRRISVHIKLDTGLTRAGLSPDEAPDFLDRLAELPAIDPEGIFTHFASADEADKSTTEKQLGVYLETVRRLEQAGHSFAIKHVANTGATLDLPDIHLDMVRTGIAVYGYYPSNEVTRPIALRPALSLVSVTSRVRQVGKGTGIGYGHEFKCVRDSVVALVPIGYGDGLPRSLGHGAGHVLVRDTEAPIVGRISMDQITVDVTDVPHVAVGDEVVLIGRSGKSRQDADDVAAAAGTISYDILTGLLPRIPRLYVQDGQIVGVLGLDRNVVPI